MIHHIKGRNIIIFYALQLISVCNFLEAPCILNPEAPNTCLVCLYVNPGLIMTLSDCELWHSFQQFVHGFVFIDPFVGQLFLTQASGSRLLCVAPGPSAATCRRREYAFETDQVYTWFCNFSIRNGCTLERCSDP